VEGENVNTVKTRSMGCQVRSGKIGYQQKSSLSRRDEVGLVTNTLDGHVRESHILFC